MTKMTGDEAPVSMMNPLHVLLFISIYAAIQITFLHLSVSLTTLNEEHLLKNLPLCYDTAESRKRPLPGSFRYEAQELPPYWNLSCPLEWSKYSCVHQGSIGHAQKAASWKFVPRRCRFGDVDNLAALNGKKIFFQGDSLVRQLLISWSCSLGSRPGFTKLENIDANWAVCGPNRLWPCHDTVNCIKCGEHSGFTFGGVMIIGRDNTRFTLLYGDVNYTALTSDHVIVTQVPVLKIDRTSPSLEALKEASTQWKPDNKPSVFHFLTWGSHFKTETGAYDVGALQKLEDQVGETARGCEARTRRDNVKGELAYVADRVDGVLWLEGTNDLGKAKVGGTTGAHGDCLHFCQPGPSDQIVLALEWMMIQHFSNISASREMA